MKKIAILASNNGSNFEVLVKKIHRNKIKNVELSFLFVNKKDANVILRAQKYNIKTIVSEPKDFASESDYNKNLLDILLANKIDFLILAGYMKIIPNLIIDKFKNKIINIHPSYLPKFKGLNAIYKTYKSNDLYGGVTVHYVTNGVDNGKIILQKKIKINRNKNLKYFEQKIHKLEYKIFYKAINIAINKKKEK